MGSGLGTRPGNYSKARPLYGRTLTIYEKALGPDHPLTTGYRSNLATAFESRELFGGPTPVSYPAVAPRWI